MYVIGSLFPPFSPGIHYHHVHFIYEDYIRNRVLSRRCFPNKPSHTVKPNHLLAKSSKLGKNRTEQNFLKRKNDVSRDICRREVHLTRFPIDERVSVRDVCRYLIRLKMVLKYTYTPRIEWDDCIVWVHEHAEVEMISGFSTKTGNKSIFFRWEIEFPSRNMMYCFVLLRKIEKFTQKLFTNFFCWGYNLLPWDRVLHWILEDVNWNKST